MIMRRLKIAIVGYDAYPIPSIKGGAVEELMTVLLNQNEKNPEFDFTVFTIEDEGLAPLLKNYNYTKIVQISRRGFLNVILFLYKILRRITFFRLPYRSLYMVRINKQLRNNHYDVVFFATNNYQVAQIDSKIKSHILYGVYSDYLKSDSYGINYIKKRLDSFVAIKYIGQRLKEELGEDTKVYELEGCCDIERKSLEERNVIRKKIRTKHGIDEKDIVVLYCGRLSPEKGPLQLIQAIQKVDNCKLILVGGSNFSKNEKNKYVCQLHEEASKYNDKFIFTGYIPNHTDMIEYMYASDIGVVPSVCNEAGSTALVEFRVAGVPTIISRMGGMPNYAGKETLIVENDDNYVTNLANAIKEFVEDDQLRKECTRANFDDLSYLSRDLYFERFKEMILSIVN